MLQGWQKLRLSEPELANHFSGDCNIGLLLGEPSGWLVDVDLDCPEAIELAPQFLPATPAVFGRPSAPRSHWWYIAEGAKTEKHIDSHDRSMIAELRSTGLQTVVGPSIHPDDGDQYDMMDAIPAKVDAGELSKAVKSLAEAVLARRHPPAQPRPQARTDDFLERRAAAYLDAMPPAISGSGGHNATYAAATAMVHGFGLSPDVALALLASRYNPRCNPPWSEKELQHKVSQAATKPHDRPRGWLAAQTMAQPACGVDLSEFNKPKPSGPKDPGPFPQHLLYVPGLVGDVMEYNLATAHRPQPVLALAGALCLQAVLAGRKVGIGDKTRTNIYCVSLGPSGCGKEQARQVNKRILVEAGLSQLEGPEDLASDSGLMSAVSHQPALLLQIDEFGRFLRTTSNADRSPHLFKVVRLLLSLFTSAGTTIKGKAFGNREQNRDIDQPCVVLHGTTVPKNFLESLTTDNVADGFVSRLMVFETDTIPDLNQPDVQVVPDRILDAARWWGEFKPGGNLRSEHPQPVQVPRTDAARQIMEELAKVAERKLRTQTATAGVWSRANEKAERLALLHACSANRERPVVDADSAGWASGLAEYLTRRLEFLADAWIAEGAVDAIQKRIVRIVRESGGKIGRRELTRRTQFLRIREREDAIENLLTGGILVQVQKETPTNKGVEYAMCE